MITNPSGAQEDWTVMLKPDVRGLVIEHQDPAFYRRVAVTAGAGGLLEQYIEKLSVLLAVPEDIDGT